MSKRWSTADIAKLEQLQASGGNLREMAAIFNRTVGAVYYQIHRDRMRERSRSAHQDYKSLRQSLNVTSVTQTPPHLWAERDARRNEYRTPAQELMGDPVPSQSALYKR